MIDWTLLPDALAWKYPDAVHSTFVDSEGVASIRFWVHPQIAQPNEFELEQVLQDYWEQSSNLPDWEGFFGENLPLFISLLSRSPNPIVADFLKIEFGKRPDLDLHRLSSYWGMAIAPILVETETQRLNLSCVRFHIPLFINSSGQMEVK